jgi:hypothetical protein
MRKVAVVGAVVLIQRGDEIEREQREWEHSESCWLFVFGVAVVAVKDEEQLIFLIAAFFWFCWVISVVCGVGSLPLRI